MNVMREVYEAEAAVTRRAVPVRSLRHVHFDRAARQLVLYQFAGNEFSVIGMAFGRPGDEPEYVIACPDPLDRNDVARRLEPLRNSVLEWLDSYTVTANTSDPTRIRFSAASAPQLLLAGAGVVQALDNLSYDWRFNQDLDATWRRLGEELWLLLGLRHIPGQAAVVPLAESIAEHWALGISTLEAAKLALDVALLTADEQGLSREGVRRAEEIEAGPLGRPDLLDEPVWSAAQRGQRRAPPVVERTLRQTWNLCNTAYRQLVALSEATSATEAHARSADSWAYRVGPARTGLGFRRRRAQPRLASAAAELGRLERAHLELTTRRALEDPLIAAELAADGKAARTQLRFTSFRLGRATIVRITGVAEQPIPPPAGALVGIGGGSVLARLRTVQRQEQYWALTLEVSGATPGTKGIRIASQLGAGTYWLVAVPEPGPPALAAPVIAPSTHPNAIAQAVAS
jgi:hypothetical protein